MLVDSQWVTFDFMKVAVNVARRDPEGPNDSPAFCEVGSDPTQAPQVLTIKCACWRRRVDGVRCRSHVMDM